MINIVGQTRLLSIIDSYTKETLPKSLLFIGPSGCGKHTFAKYVAEKFDLDFLELGEDIFADGLDKLLFSTLDTLYLVDLSKFSEKQQNQLLKFIEEPSKSVYIILTTNSEAGVLNTILNRCIKYHFEAYTIQQLEAITNTSINSKAFEIFKTPGKLLNLTTESFKAVIELAEKVVFKINLAPYANALVISTKINYKDLYNKIDFYLFLDAVEYIALEDYKANSTEQSLTVFRITNQFKQHATKQTLIKEMLMFNYITTLWEAVQ